MGVKRQGHGMPCPCNRPVELQLHEQPRYRSKTRGVVCEKGELVSGGLEKLSHAAKFLIAAIEEFRDGESREIAKRVLKNTA